MWHRTFPSSGDESQMFTDTRWSVTSHKHWDRINHKISWQSPTVLGQRRPREDSGRRWKALLHLTGPPLLTQRMESSQTRRHSYPAALQKGSKTARPGVTYHISGKNSLAECLSLKVYPVSLPYSPREGLAPQPQPNPLLPTLFLSLGNSTTELYLGTALLDTATLMKTHMRQAWEGNLQESRLGFSEKQEEHRIKWKWENYLLRKF